jgi:putative molybdopterin biosynthesis protein
VAAAIAQRRVDWGVAIQNVAEGLKLGFLPIVDEQYDLVIPKARLERPPVQALLALLRRPEAREALRGLGMTVAEPSNTGEPGNSAEPGTTAQARTAAERA